MDPNRNMMEEIFKMTKENNKMLHGMRKRAFIGGILKVLLWTLFLIAPVWFYMTYLNDTVQGLVQSMEKMQSTGSTAMQGFSDLNDKLQELQSKLPSFFTGSSTSKGN